MINTPNLASGANIGRTKNYEIESNSILIPDYYIISPLSDHFYGNWMDYSENLLNVEKEKDINIYSWESRTEKAFFTGMPTSLHMELFEDLDLPTDNSYATALMIFSHFKKHIQIYPRLEALLVG